MYEDLKDLYMKTVPEIFKFEQKIEEHRRDIQKQAEVLRRFDELLSEKASKNNLKEMAAENVKKYAPLDNFITHKVAINSRADENEKSISNVRDLIDLLGKNITKDIFAAVKRAT